MNQNITENVLWSGRPKQGLMIALGDIFMIPISIFWCGFAIGLAVLFEVISAPIIITLVGMMFVCVGIYLVLVGLFTIQ